MLNLLSEEVGHMSSEVFVKSALLHSEGGGGGGSSSSWSKVFHKKVRLGGRFYQVPSD